MWFQIDFPLSILVPNRDTLFINSYYPTSDFMYAFHFEPLTMAIRAIYSKLAARTVFFPAQQGWWLSKPGTRFSLLPLIF